MMDGLLPIPLALGRQSGRFIGRHAERLAVAPRQLDRGRAHQLVERGLGRAVGVPAAQRVVTDAAHSGREEGRQTRPLPRQQRQEMAHHQRRADGVDREAVRQRIGVQVLPGALGFGART